MASAMLAGLLATCGGPAIENRAGPFWQTFQNFGLEVSQFESLAELLEASDAVVIARVRGVAVSRVLRATSLATGCP